ncbi:hypothetical protein [Streptomyces sp. NPDC057545]|uniref:hypothetical protein n=1 Tax=Streptomyces sp. NPDC057545 TaxID=3346164 RepID=UPI00368137E6
MDWRPLLVFPALLLAQYAARVLGPLLRGRRKLGKAALVVAWPAGVVLSAAVVVFGVNLLSDTDRAAPPRKRCGATL